jgi:hypothetical protein
MIVQLKDPELELSLSVRPTEKNKPSDAVSNQLGGGSRAGAPQVPPHIGLTPLALFTLFTFFDPWFYSGNEEPSQNKAKTRNISLLENWTSMSRAENDDMIKKKWTLMRPHAVHSLAHPASGTPNQI